MTIKRYLLFLLVAMALLPACQKKRTATSYDISGVFKHAEGQLLQLEDFSQVPYVIMDSAHIQNGTFHFKGYAKEGMYRLRFPNSDNAYVVLYHKKGSVIRVDFDLRDPGAQQVKGNEESAWLTAMARDLRLRQDSIHTLNMALDTLIGKASDSILNIERDKIAGLGEAYKLRVKKYIEEQNNPLLSAYAMTFYGDVSKDIDYFIARAEVLLENDPEAPFVKQIYDELTAVRQRVLEENDKGLPVGSKAPDIALPSRTGDTLSLYSLKGNYVLVDFWASWCAPCRDANPELVKLYKKYHARGFEIFSVSLDKKAEQWNNARLKDGLYWRYHVSDLQMWRSPVVAQYRVNSIPCTYLLDPNGVILARNLHGKELDAKLDAVLKPLAPVDTVSN